MIYALKRFSLCLLHILGISLLLSSPVSRAGTVIHTTFDSQVLQAPYPMTVYLPDQNPTQGSAYPVVYLLHGSFGSENDWLAGLGKDITRRADIFAYPAPVSVT